MLMSVPEACITATKMLSVSMRREHSNVNANQDTQEMECHVFVSSCPLCKKPGYTGDAVLCVHKIMFFM